MVAVDWIILYPIISNAYAVCSNDSPCLGSYLAADGQVSRRLPCPEAQSDALKNVLF